MSFSFRKFLPSLIIYLIIYLEGFPKISQGSYKNGRLPFRVPDDADEPTVAALALDEERRVDGMTKMDVGVRLCRELRARRGGERAEVRVGLGLADFEVEAKDDAQRSGPRLYGNQHFTVPSYMLDDLTRPPSLSKR